MAICRACGGQYEPHWVTDKKLAAAESKLAEARAIISWLLPLAECWCEDGRGEDDGTLDRARAWLAKETP